MPTKNTKSILKLSAPWVNYAREIHALFCQDPEIRVEYDENEVEVKLFVENTAKAEALAKLLPSTKTFANVVLKITIIPANMVSDSSMEILKVAFDGNPIVTGIIEGSSDPSMYSSNYILFKKKVVQYFNDDLSDANRVRSTLYADIAKEVIGEPNGIHFCTDVKDPVDLLDSPLGEWP